MLVLQMLVLPFAGEFLSDIHLTVFIFRYYSFRMSHSENDDYDYEYSDGEATESSETDDSRYRGRRRRHRDRPRSHSERRSRSRSRHSHSRRGPSPATQPAHKSSEPGDCVDGARMTLCSVHKNNLVPATCKVCKHMTHIIKGDMAKQLVVDGTVIPTASERLLRKRSDQAEATLTFTDEELALAEKIYSQGMFKRGHFDELSKKFLFLPAEQNQLLSQNIETEDLFRPYEHESRYQHIFKYKNQVLSVLRQLRISTRPLVLALSHSTELARHVRKSEKVQERKTLQPHLQLPEGDD